ncbi:MAG: hypothetical protein KJ069_31945 [Anaerolineae bacterium]|nr:hypothetical protein [Anaerolineae bacterium]
MITISGRVQLTFTLPTAVTTAFHFYQDIHRILPYLPRIALVQAYGAQHVRVCYLSRELNAYDVAIYCDVHAEADPTSYTIRLTPREAGTPVKAKSSFNRTEAYGRYTSTSIFYPDGDRTGGERTRLEYSLELAAELPKPWATKLVPDSIMDAIANSITNHRIHEIASGFITKSALDIPAWAAQNEQRIES